MKKLSTISGPLAFTLSIASVLVFEETDTINGIIEVKGKDMSCPLGTVSDECHLASEGPACTFKYNLSTYKAVPKEAVDCAIASVLRKPDS